MPPLTLYLQLQPHTLPVRPFTKHIVKLFNNHLLTVRDWWDWTPPCIVQLNTVEPREVGRKWDNRKALLLTHTTHTYTTQNTHAHWHIHDTHTYITYIQYTTHTTHTYPQQQTLAYSLCSWKIYCFQQLKFIWWRPIQMMDIIRWKQ